VRDLWSDPKQYLEPPFSARIANAIKAYPDTTALTGLVTLTDPTSIPHFHLTAPEQHPLLKEQRKGVSAQKALGWIASIYHPEPETE
jgi:hypothetical protein